VAAWLGSVGEQRREPLDPPVDADMVDLDAALGEQFLNVAVRQGEAQIPADRDDDDVGWNREPAKADRTMGAGRGRRGLMATVSPLRRGHGERNRAVFGTHRPEPDRPGHPADPGCAAHRRSRPFWPGSLCVPFGPRTSRTPTATATGSSRAPSQPLGPTPRIGDTPSNSSRVQVRAAHTVPQRQQLLAE